MTAAELDRILTITDILICLIDMVLVIMLFRQRTSAARNGKSALLTLHTEKRPQRVIRLGMRGQKRACN